MNTVRALAPVTMRYGALSAYAEHGVLRAFGDGVLFDPCRVARADDEQPFAVAACMRDHDRRAGEQRALLEAVDVGVAALR